MRAYDRLAGSLTVKQQFLQDWALGNLFRSHQWLAWFPPCSCHHGLPDIDHQELCEIRSNLTADLSVSLRILRGPHGLRTAFLQVNLLEGVLIHWRWCDDDHPRLVCFYHRMMDDGLEISLKLSDIHELVARSSWKAGIVRWTQSTGGGDLVGLFYLRKRLTWIVSAEYPWQEEIHTKRTT